MIYEVTPTPDIREVLALSLELEQEREQARKAITQEINDRHAAALLLIGQYHHAENRAAYMLLHRAVNRLQREIDALFTVLEVL